MGCQTLRGLKFRNRFGIHVSSVLRGQQRINIPNGETIIFPGDKLQIIGNDEQLHKFNEALEGELIPEDPYIEKREMKLQQFEITKGNQFIGKTLKESGIRNQYNVMVVGVEEGQDSLTMIDPSRKFTEGDIIWVVGEKDNLNKLEKRQ